MNDIIYFKYDRRSISNTNCFNLIKKKKKKRKVLAIYESFRYEFNAKRSLNCAKFPHLKIRCYILILACVLCASIGNRITDMWLQHDTFVMRYTNTCVNHFHRSYPWLRTHAYNIFMYLCMLSLVMRMSELIIKWHIQSSLL